MPETKRAPAMPNATPTWVLEELFGWIPGRDHVCARHHPQDRHIDHPPRSGIHLRVADEGQVVTSFGLVVVEAG